MPSGLLDLFGTERLLAGDVLYHSAFEAVHEIRDLSARAQVFLSPKLPIDLEFKCFESNNIYMREKTQSAGSLVYWFVILDCLLNVRYEISAHTLSLLIIKRKQVFHQLVESVELFIVQLRAELSERLGYSFCRLVVNFHSFRNLRPSRLYSFRRARSASCASSAMNPALKFSVPLWG